MGIVQFVAGFQLLPLSFQAKKSVWLLKLEPEN